MAAVGGDAARAATRFGERPVAGGRVPQRLRCKVPFLLRDAGPDEGTCGRDG
jgi:hypothetical protein